MTSAPSASSPNAWTLVFLVALAPAGTTVAAEGEPAQSPAQEVEYFQLEGTEARQGLLRARDDPLARSPGLRVARGPYVSVQVNVDQLGQNIVGDAANEPAMVVNATNPDNIVMAWRQFDSVSSPFRQAAWAYSFDAGQSWTFPGVLDAGTNHDDPVLDSDSQGHLYYQTISGMGAGIFDEVYKSEDGGVTWSDAVYAFGGDKSWLVIDRTGGMGEGHLYATWQPLIGCCPPDMMTRSTDGGASWELPVEIALSPIFGTLAVASDGTLYAAGAKGLPKQDFDRFIVARSTNAQDASATPTFTSTLVEIGGSMVIAPAVNPGGLAGQANVAVDNSGGPFDGAVYVLASVDPLDGNDPMEVHVIRSTDGGTTWTDPVRVNDDPVDSLTWQWFAALSVAPNGRLDAVWNDTRNSPAQPNLCEMFYAYSYDGGQTWSPNVPVSPQFDSHVGWPVQDKIGDYYTMASDRTGANVAYAATFNDEQDIYYLRVFPDCNENAISDVNEVLDGVAPDCNGNEIPDGCEDSVSCTASGSVPDGAAVPGQQLTLDRSGEDGIALSWGSSCLVGDEDYEVYEGTLGDFASHAPKVCTTFGETGQEFTPAPGNTYYLVVPRNSGREGSYGLDSDGIERSLGVSSCVPREIGPCF